MKFYHVKDEYIEYLRKYDPTVLQNKQMQRPYVGIVLDVGGVQYCAPLTSPKEKHKHMKNGKDFRKIAQGRYGAINFNNMIPVVEEALELININEEPDEKYRRLLQNQYKEIDADQEGILRTAMRLHDLIYSDEEVLTPQDQIIKQRCCNLPLLDMVSSKYGQDAVNE